MPNVPQVDYYGMREAFAELIRQRFSTERNLFPDAQNHPDYIAPKIITDLDELRQIAKCKYNKSFGGMLLVNNQQSPEHQDIAWGIAPSILFHAQEEGKYNKLIHNYNKFVRAILLKKDHATIDQSYITFNDTFKSTGGLISHFRQGGVLDTLNNMGPCMQDVLSQFPKLNIKQYDKYDQQISQQFLSQLPKDIQDRYVPYNQQQISNMISEVVANGRANEAVRFIAGLQSYAKDSRPFKGIRVGQQSKSKIDGELSVIQDVLQKHTITDSMLLLRGLNVGDIDTIPTTIGEHFKTTSLLSTTIGK